MASSAGSPRRMPAASLSPKDDTHSGGVSSSFVEATANATPLSSFSSPSPSANHAGGAAAAGSRSSSPRIDRGVRTRTHDRITLQLSSLAAETSESTGTSTSGPATVRAGATGDRGWRSPHGEPYRPLGNPELSLKFTPRLPSDSPSRSRTFQDSNPAAKDSSGGQREPSHATASQSSPQQQPTQETVLSMFPRNLRKRPPEDRQLKLALRLQESMAQYSPDKVRSLRRADPITITRMNADGRTINDRDADGDPEEDEDTNVHAALRRLQQQHLHNQANRDRAAGVGAGGVSSSSFSSVSVSSPSSASALSFSPACSPPRFHVEHGDTSVHLLRGAVQQGVARLRLARNGQHFLDAVPSVEAPELTALKRRYDVARVKFLAELETHRKLGPSAPRLLGSKPAHTDDSDDTGDQDASSRGSRQPSQSPEAHGGRTSTTATLAYLPYTTRLPQTSPHAALPTLAEFKAKIRGERMPQRLLLSSRASLASLAPSSPSGGTAQRKSSTRKSRVGSILLASCSSSSSPEKHATPNPLLSSPVSPSSACAAPSPPPAKLSRIHSRRGSVVLPASGEQGQRMQLSVLGTAEGDALVRMAAQLANGPVSPPAAHSVVRLQETVDAMESAKHTQCGTLAKTLSLLDHDRRDCLTVKYRHFHLDTDAEHDISVMRDAAESDRVDCAQTNLARYHWYADLLRHMVANHESSFPSAPSSSPASSSSSQTNALHPAELFCIEVIRHVASDGHAFDSEQLFYLVQQLHPEDVMVHEVQQILTFLRRVLRIPLSDWSEFFKAHNLQEPVEIFKQSDAKLKEKKKQLRMAKLRTVITLNHVLKRLTTPTIIPPPIATGLDEEVFHEVL